MDTTERFKRMREVEKQVGILVKKGWNVKRILYDDEANCPMHATITLTVDGESKVDGVL